MIYLPEYSYYFRKKDFPFEKAVIVTAKSISKGCKGYKAQLISPKKGIKECIKEGTLPKSQKEKEKFIENIFKWIFDNSFCSDLFAFFLYEDYPHLKNYPAKFDHHDDTCCWCLNLDEKEFEELKKVLKKNKLPDDLFYSEDKLICVLAEPGIMGRFLNKIGFTIESKRCYTPKEWENRNKSG